MLSLARAERDTVITSPKQISGVGNEDERSNWKKMSCVAHYTAHLFSPVPALNWTGVRRSKTAAGEGGGVGGRQGRFTFRPVLVNSQTATHQDSTFS